ncbi:phosphotransferase family protein [Bosea sp. NBC_00550]|uniref:phosphotransferase family protein n=1 Tax=Bosea sp. NBC_00550 TaxID=2969621 RepID=UPI00223285F9|nr:phosphotransferase family protein [Bosea sp. NBC_00550]UZF95448.1 phosphotransferase family protein [Bosea sp. NBC_00550]
MTAQVATLVDVIDKHRFDEAALARWLRVHIPGFDGPVSIRQFQGGQSNPTFLIASGDRRCVLRKKPSGQLLPKAHQVEREFAIISALGPTSVPVPEVMALCADADVIGTPFYLMGHVDGRHFDGLLLADQPRDGRAAINYDAVDTLARLHAVDPAAIGLADYGPQGGYVARQVERWTKQYRASSAQAGEIADLGWLADWLRERRHVSDETAIVHGDYRTGNLLYRHDAPQVAAILDWELSTLGHPIADLAYYCMTYRIDARLSGGRGLAGLDLRERGIPGETEVLDRYSQASGRVAIADWPVFLALSFFRLSAILHGVMARAVQGNASDANALDVANRAGALAQIGRAIAHSEHR